MFSKLIKPKRNYQENLNSSQHNTHYLSSGEKYISGKEVGGMWEEIGNLQFQFILEQGLQPSHKFLDVGCGSLRGGIHFINYLNDGNYYGIDKSKYLLTAAKEIEIPKYNLSKKKINLLEDDSFSFSEFGVKFDYAIAQSVFTHLDWNTILRCLVNISKILKDSNQGKFFATFFEDETGDFYLDSIQQSPGNIITFSDKDPYHYKFDVFEELANRIGLEVNYIGDWNHPRNQKMMVFTHR